MSEPLEQEKLDVENAFLLYATFCGDVERTAHACGVSASDIIHMSQAEGWNQKLEPILALKKSSEPGDVERAINRALCFVQAHKMRMFLEKVLRKFAAMDDSELDDYIFAEQEGKFGITKKLNTRPFADLAAAMEKCHCMAYLALNDSTSERTKRKEESPHDSGGELHAQLSKAFADMRAPTPAKELFQAQLDAANSLNEKRA